MKSKTLPSKPSNTSKRPVNLYLDRHTENLAGDLCKLEDRSLSKLVKHLIQREAVRRGLLPKAA